MEETQTQKRPVLTALRLVAAFVLGLVLIIVSMVLLIFGVILIIWGVNGLFTGFDGSGVGADYDDARFGGLAIAVGVAAIAGGVRTMTRLTLRTVSRVSGREFAVPKLRRTR